jgi:hypothetical protein
MLYDRIQVNVAYTLQYGSLYLRYVHLRLYVFFMLLDWREITIVQRGMEIRAIRWAVYLCLGLLGHKISLPCLLIPILSQTNLLNVSSYFFQIHFIIFLPSSPGL